MQATPHELVAGSAEAGPQSDEMMPPLGPRRHLLIGSNTPPLTRMSHVRQACEKRARPGGKAEAVLRADISRRERSIPAKTSW